MKKAVRKALLLGAAVALAACGVDLDSTASMETEPGEAQAPLMMVEPGRGIPDAYIVKLKDGADPRSVAAIAGVSPRYVYTLINGFAATLSEGQLMALRKNSHVEYVEQDGVVHSRATQPGAPWNLDRLDQRALPLNGTYNYFSTASTVNAYIIDTGIFTGHSEFGGRANNVYDALGGTGADCNGHGTCMAGIVGGATYGVAKGVKLKGVRVLDCSGSGSWSAVIAAMDWVRLNRVNPAVANLSLGGGFNSTVNTAANNLANSGVFLAVAAGSNSGDACSYSPASAASATTVGATASNDTRSSFSNYGSCVDIYAPGSSATCPSLSGGTTTMSGTSVAAAHVTGVAALYKATYGNAASSTIDSWVKTNGTSLSFGKLLYKSSL
jgi:subtilisin family serine protease